MAHFIAQLNHAAGYREVIAYANYSHFTFCEQTEKNRYTLKKEMDDCNSEPQTASFP